MRLQSTCPWGGMGMVAAVVMALAGCVSYTVVGDSAAGGSQGTSGRTAASSADGKITIAQLDQMTKAYADRYMTLIASACDAIEQDNENFQQRRMAHRFKLTSTTSVYDIVTNADPFTQLVDLMLVVTLQSQVWIDDARADEVFGDRADLLIRPLRQAREDIWSLGSKVMKPQQLAVLDQLIWDWRSAHEQVRFVAFVRFNDFAASRGKSIIADVKRRGTGFLAPVDEAKRAVDEARLFGERVFFLSKRAPFLVAWQLEAAVNELLAKHQVSATLAAVDSLGRSIDRVSQVAEKLPGRIAAERQALQKGLVDQTESTRQVLDEYRSAVVETDRLAGSLNQVGQTAGQTLEQMRQASAALEKTIASADRLVARFDRPGPANVEQKPFDINEYTQAAAELSRTAAQWNQVLDSAHQLMASESWNRRLAEIDATAARQLGAAAQDSRGLIELLFRRLLVLIVVTFALLGGYRYYASRLARRTADA